MELEKKEEKMKVCLTGFLNRYSNERVREDKSLGEIYDISIMKNSFSILNYLFIFTFLVIPNYILTNQELKILNF